MKRIFLIVAISLFVSCSCKLNNGISTSVAVAVPKQKVDLNIASFNVRFFDSQKSNKIDIVKVVSKITSKFDIVAFQEIQGAHNLTVYRLHRQLPKNYMYIVSRELGYSKRYKERYAYFYNKDVFEYMDSYIFNDTLDNFSREPFIALFRVIENSEQVVFINIHTPPKFATREIKRLPGVIADADARYASNKIITLGDFNADCSYYNEEMYTKVFPPSRFIWAIPNDMKTAIITGCTYDRIVLTNNLGEGFIDSGVYNFKLRHGFTLKQALRISDHYPVWVKLKI